MDVDGHERAEDAAGDGREHHHGPAGPAAAVDERPEERRDHGEGGQGEQQVEQDLLLGGVRGDGEEQRPGQRDGDQGVAGQHEHLDQCQAPEGLALVEQVVEGLLRQGPELVHSVADGHRARVRGHCAGPGHGGDRAQPGTGAVRPGAAAVSWRRGREPGHQHRSTGPPGRGGAHMPTSAYVLIQTAVGKAADVAGAVAAIEGVVVAEDVTGPYDVIARAEARSVNDLGRLVVSEIQRIEGVTRTLTCPVVDL